MFLDGNQVYSASNSSNFNPSNTSIGYIGSAIQGIGWCKGYITEIRSVVGSSAYNISGNTIQVPTSYITSTGTDTKLLISANSKQIVDSSSNSYAITLANAPSIEAWSPYTSIDKQTGFELPATTNGGSFSFDVSDSTAQNRGKILIPKSTDFTFGTGDFTVEMWLYHRSTSTATTVYTLLVDMRTSSGPSNSVLFGIKKQGSARNPYMYGANNDSTNQIEVVFSNLEIPLNQWHHLAFVREGNSLDCYLNGTKDSSNTRTLSGFNLSDNGYSSNAHQTAYQNHILIGMDGTNSQGNFDGSMTDLRFVKGKAVYTGNFTPPSGKLGLTQSAGTNISAITSGETKLLLQPFQPKSLVNSSVFNIADSYNKGEANKNLTYVGDTKVVDFSPYKGGSHGSFFSVWNASYLFFIIGILCGIYELEPKKFRNKIHF